MRNPDDLWYVRLPDGRVVRAGSTRALRYHLTTGRVPWNSWVRRSPADDWATLDWTPEFADLSKKRDQPKPLPAEKEDKLPTPAEEPPPPRVLGVRGLVEELLGALEASFNAVKLSVAAGMGLAVGLAMVGGQLAFAFLDHPWHYAVAGGWAALMLLFYLLGSVVLTRMTVLEAARLRPARARDVRSRLATRTLQLFVAQLLICGFVVGLLWVLPWLRDWLQSRGEPMPEGVLAVFAASRLILEVICWPILVCSFLLAPILVVEHTGAFGTVSRWCSLLHIHLGRLLVYEALALAIGLVVTLPFLAPLAVAAWQNEFETGLPLLVRANLLALLAGLALTPLLSYFTIANAHIYLNVQYEFSQSARVKQATKT